MYEQKGLSQNITVKFAAKTTTKEKETFLRSWTILPLERPLSTKFLYARKLKLFKISHGDKYALKY